MAIRDSRLQRYVALALVCLFCFSLAGAAQAPQVDEIIVIAFAPPWPMPHLLTEGFFRPFEAAHPNVDVVAVDPPELPLEAAGQDFPMLAYMEALTRSADVFYPLSLSPLETRAGLVRDLAPFIAADAELDMERSFYPGLRDAFEWDGGMWALPAAWRLNMLGYHPATFDAAGLPHPQADWTWERFAEIMRRYLAATSQAPLIQPYVSPAHLAVSLAGAPLAEADARPALEQESLRMALERLDLARQEGWLRTDEAYFWDQDHTGLLTSYWGSWQTGERHAFAYTALPGGRVILEAQGLAVSSGATHPELAYALTKFLSERLELVSLQGSLMPARQDIDMAEAEAQILGFGPRYAGLREAHERLLPLAMPARDTVYIHALAAATAQADELTIEERLRAAQESLVQALAAAEAYEPRISIDKPLSDLAPPGSVVIRFGLSDGAPSPYARAVKDFARDFVAAHPTIDRVKVGSLAGSWNLYEDEFDCVYGDAQALAEMPISSIIRLDRLAEADPSFDRASYLPAALEAATHQDVLWALPIAMQPLALRYDPTAFAENDLPSPSSGWTIEEFDAALRTLWQVSKTEVFRPGFDSPYLLLLMAAHGGLPVEYRGDSPSYDLSAPTTVEAIRAVLDYARRGLSGYPGLNTDYGSSIGSLDHPIFVDDLADPHDYRGADFPLVDFPQRGGRPAMAYSVGLGYIKAKTERPQACYEWIRALAQRPQIFGGLPARLDLADMASATSAIAPNGQTYFEDFVLRLADERRLILPEANPWSEIRWLHEAFDSYALRGEPLESALAAANAKIEAYRQCIADSSSARAWECAERVDASGD